MNGILNFFKEIFMFNQTPCKSVGLCPFKTDDKDLSKKTVSVKLAKEVKLSDLMRRSA